MEILEHNEDYFPVHAWHDIVKNFCHIINILIFFHMIFFSISASIIFFIVFVLFVLFRCHLIVYRLVLFI